MAELLTYIFLSTQDVRYSRRVLDYSLRYSPNTRVANYSYSTALLHVKGVGRNRLPENATQNNKRNNNNKHIC